MQKHIFSYFSMAHYVGLLNNVSVTFTDKIDPFDSLRREDYWRQTIKTMTLCGLNIEDSVLLVFLFLLFYMIPSLFLRGNFNMF